MESTNIFNHTTNSKQVEDETKERIEIIATTSRCIQDRIELWDLGGDFENVILTDDEVNITTNANMENENINEVSIGIDLLSSIESKMTEHDLSIIKENLIEAPTSVEIISTSRNQDQIQCDHNAVKNKPTLTDDVKLTSNAKHTENDNVDEVNIDINMTSTKSKRTEHDLRTIEENLIEAPTSIEIIATSRIQYQIECDLDVIEKNPTLTDDVKLTSSINAKQRVQNENIDGNMSIDIASIESKMTDRSTMVESTSIDEIIAKTILFQDQIDECTLDAIKNNPISIDNVNLPTDSEHSENENIGDVNIDIDLRPSIESKMTEHNLCTIEDNLMEAPTSIEIISTNRIQDQTQCDLDPIDNKPSLREDLNLTSSIKAKHKENKNIDRNVGIDMISTHSKMTDHDGSEIEDNLIEVTNLDPIKSVEPQHPEQIIENEIDDAHGENHTHDVFTCSSTIVDNTEQDLDTIVNDLEDWKDLFSNDDYQIFNKGMDEFMKTTVHFNVNDSAVSCSETIDAGEANHCVDNNHIINSSSEKMYDTEAVIWRTPNFHADSSPATLKLMNDFVFYEPFLSESLDECHSKALKPSTGVLETSLVIRSTIGIEKNTINDLLSCVRKRKYISMIPSKPYNEPYLSKKQIWFGILNKTTRRSCRDISQDAVVIFHDRQSDNQLPKMNCWNNYDGLSSKAVVVSGFLTQRSSTEFDNLAFVAAASRAIAPTTSDTSQTSMKIGRGSNSHSISPSPRPSNLSNSLVPVRKYFSVEDEATEDSLAKNVKILLSFALHLTMAVKKFGICCFSNNSGIKEVKDEGIASKNDEPKKVLFQEHTSSFAEFLSRRRDKARSSAMTGIVDRAKCDGEPSSSFLGNSFIRDNDKASFNNIETWFNNEVTVNNFEDQELLEDSSECLITENACRENIAESSKVASLFSRKVSPTDMLTSEATFDKVEQSNVLKRRRSEEEQEERKKKKARKARRKEKRNAKNIASNIGSREVHPKKDITKGNSKEREDIDLPTSNASKSVLKDDITVDFTTDQSALETARNTLKAMNSVRKQDSSLKEPPIALRQTVIPVSYIVKAASLQKSNTSQIQPAAGAASHASNQIMKSNNNNSPYQVGANKGNNRPFSVPSVSSAKISEDMLRSTAGKQNCRQVSPLESQFISPIPDSKPLSIHVDVQRSNNEFNRDTNRDFVSYESCSRPSSMLFENALSNVIDRKEVIRKTSSNQFGFPETSNVHVMKKPPLISNYSQLRFLCSEHFLERWQSVITELATGAWRQSATDDWTELNDKLKIHLVDSCLVDACKVDIELPGRCGIITIPISLLVTSEVAKNLVIDIAKLVSTGRYVFLYILICYDCPSSDLIVRHIAQLQCAFSASNGLPITQTYFKHATLSSLANTIGCTMLLRVPCDGPYVNRNHDSIIDAVSNEMCRDRALFLLSLLPTLSAYGAIEVLILAREILPDGPFFKMLFQNERLRQKIMLTASSKPHECDINPEAIVQLSRALTVSFSKYWER